MLATVTYHLHWSKVNWPSLIIVVMLVALVFAWKRQKDGKKLSEVAAILGFTFMIFFVALFWAVFA